MISPSHPPPPPLTQLRGGPFTVFPFHRLTRVWFPGRSLSVQLVSDYRPVVFFFEDRMFVRRGSAKWFLRVCCVLVGLSVAMAASPISTADPDCFFSMGDWGARNAHVRRIAETMSKAAPPLAKQADAPPPPVGCGALRFVAALGDNFYYEGISDPRDPRWRETFFQFYQHASLQVPWLGVLGNHDYGNMYQIGASNAQAQVDYDRLDVDGTKWTMPNFYYTLDVAFDGRPRTGRGGKFEFREGRDVNVHPTTFDDAAANTTAPPLILRVIVIDTVSMLECTVRGQDHYLCMHKEQQAWLEATLAEASHNASLDAIIVLGHHNIASATHYRHPPLDAYLVALFRRHRVSLYAFGHMHFGSFSVDVSLTHWLPPAADEVTHDADNLAKSNGGGLVFMCNGLGRGATTYKCTFRGWEKDTVANLTERWCTTLPEIEPGGFAIHRMWRESSRHGGHGRIMLEHCFVNAQGEVIHCRRMPARGPREMTPASKQSNPAASDLHNREL